MKRKLSDIGTNADGDIKKRHARFIPENEQDAKKLQTLHLYEQKARALRKLLMSKQTIIGVRKVEENKIGELEQ